MKSLLLVLLSLFVFIGCTAKKEISISNKTVIKQPKPIIVQKTNPMFNKEKSLFDIIEEVEIIESETVVIEDDGLNKIAIIYPSRVVGKYAKSTISTVSAYLIFNNQDFSIETFDTYNEDPENIIRELSLLNEKGFTKVIAMFTQNGFDILNTLEELDFAKFYFPLINKQDVMTENENFIFGGISYQDQMDLINTLSNGKNTMFYKKGGYTETKLKDLYVESTDNPGIIKEITKKQNNYKSIMNDKRMRGNTILLNTYPVKSSIILSQLTAYEINPAVVLSTQINYNPILVKLTQAKDRKKLYVVNSISEVDNFIEGYTKLLGGNIRYNWVDYSSLVGVNYLLNDNESEIVHTLVIDNQVDYEPTLYKSTSYGFKKVLSN